MRTINRFLGEDLGSNISENAAHLLPAGTRVAIIDVNGEPVYGTVEKEHQFLDGDWQTFVRWDAAWPDRDHCFVDNFGWEFYPGGSGMVLAPCTWVPNQRIRPLEALVIGCGCEGCLSGSHLCPGLSQ